MLDYAIRSTLLLTLTIAAVWLLRERSAAWKHLIWLAGLVALLALPGAKIVPGTFGTVLVAAALPKGRSPAAQALLATLIDEAKQTGVVREAIDAKRLKGVEVATK